MIADRAPPAKASTITVAGVDTASLQKITDIDPAELQKILTAIAATQKALRSKRSRTGLAAAKRRGQKLGRPPAMNEAQTALARRMMIEGATRRTIARALTVSLSTLYYALKPYAAEAPPRPKPRGRSRLLTDSQVELARRMLADGVPRKIIAITLKVSRTTVSIALRPYAEGPFPQMRRRTKKPGADFTPLSATSRRIERRE